MLEEYENQILLGSVSVLDTCSYSDVNSYKKGTWEYSAIGRWLNNDFYKAAFTQDEKSVICNVKITTYDKGHEGTQRTKVYVLSTDGLEGMRLERAAKNVKFAPSLENEEIYKYWTRTQDENAGVASVYCMDVSDKENPKIISVEATGVAGVRPVLWVSIAKY